jgi:hypothetical protein
MTEKVGLKFGFPAELRSRVLVWRMPDSDGWDLDSLSGYEDEIRGYVPDFMFCDANSDEVSYRFGKGGAVYSVDRGNYLVLSLETLKIRRSSEKYLLSTIHGIGL